MLAPEVAVETMGFCSKSFERPFLGWPVDLCFKQNIVAKPLVLKHCTSKLKSFQHFHMVTWTKTTWFRALCVILETSCEPLPCIVFSFFRFCSECFCIQKQFTGLRDGVAQWACGRTITMCPNHRSKPLMTCCLSAVVWQQELKNDVFCKAFDVWSFKTCSKHIVTVYRMVMENLNINHLVWWYSY